MVTRRKLLIAIGAAAVLAAVGGGFMLFRREGGAAAPTQTTARGGELRGYLGISQIVPAIAAHQQDRVGTPLGKSLHEQPRLLPQAGDVAAV